MKCAWIILAFVLMAMVPLTRGEGEKNVRKHWLVSGQIQGVGFRAFTYENAIDLGLRGWVRNLTDSRVEIVAEGSEAAVGKLMELVKKGPRSARVDAVNEAKVDEAEKLGEKFEIRDSASVEK